MRTKLLALVGAACLGAAGCALPEWPGGFVPPSWDPCGSPCGPSVACGEEGATRDPDCHGDPGACVGPNATDGSDCFPTPKDGVGKCIAGECQ